MKSLLFKILFLFKQQQVVWLYCLILAYWAFHLFISFKRNDFKPYKQTLWDNMDTFVMTKSWKSWPLVRLMSNSEYRVWISRVKDQNAILLMNGIYSRLMTVEMKYLRTFTFLLCKFGPFSITYRQQIY